MRMTIIGGGGFRVPLVHEALLDDHDGVGRVTDLTLYDVDEGRLSAISRVLDQQAQARAPTHPLCVVVTTDLDQALAGADFVFLAIRVFGLEGRRLDERIALSEGVIGQETVGAGGISYGLRTVPEAERIARRIAEIAPAAWVINFTNPVGLVTQAMARHLGDRVIGICDSPVGLSRRVLGALGLDGDGVSLDYVGINHLGWLRAVRVDGQDQLPRLLKDEQALASIEEGRLFGPAWLQNIRAIPNEYLHYYYFQREALAAAGAAKQTRGSFLLEQQRRFYDEVADDHGAAFATWERTRLEREATYMADNRNAVGAGERNSGDLVSSGYEQIALALMRAIAGNEGTTLILNVRNSGTLSVLEDDAVIEVPCLVDSSGAHPLPADPLPVHGIGLVTSVKAVDRTVIEAAATGSRAAAIQAFAIHPLVDSVAVAVRLLAAYQRHIPHLAYLHD